MRGLRQTVQCVPQVALQECDHCCISELHVCPWGGMLLSSKSVYLCCYADRKRWGMSIANCQLDFSCSCRGLGSPFSFHLLLLGSGLALATWCRQQLCRLLRDGPDPWPLSLCPPPSARSPHPWKPKYLSLSESHRENLGPEERGKALLGGCGAWGWRTHDTNPGVDEEGV